MHVYTHMQINKKVNPTKEKEQERWFNYVSASKGIKTVSSSISLASSVQQATKINQLAGLKAKSSNCIKQKGQVIENTNSIINNSSLKFNRSRQKSSKNT